LPLKPSQSYPDELQHLISAFNLKQHITVSTHVKGGVLDLLFTRQQSTLIDSILVVDGISDHSFIKFHMTDVVPSLQSSTHVKRRRYTEEAVDWIIVGSRNISDIVISSHLNANSHCEDIVRLFDDCATALLNQHAPMKVRKLKEEMSHGY
jgi:hypothetical protein